MIMLLIIVLIKTGPNILVELKKIVWKIIAHCLRRNYQHILT